MSRGWVHRHGLKARTLLIGSGEQATAAEGALQGLTRPTTIVGYLAPARHCVTAEGCLGAVENLAAVAHDHRVGRVVIVDPEMSSDNRQALADECHDYGLQVEAVASLADIRAGTADFVVGQSIVLIRLDPLWPANRAFFVKRALDLLCATLGAMLIGIMWIPLAIAARLEGGTVLTSSRRLGVGERLFRCIGSGRRRRGHRPTRVTKSARW
jgi:hypothetical protein